MLNEFHFIGRMVACPELKHSTEGVAFTRFSVAVDRDFKNRNGTREADFFDVIAWRSQAEYVCKFGGKGLLVNVNGAVRQRTFNGSDGKNYKGFEVEAGKVYVLEKSKPSFPDPREGAAAEDTQKGEKPK